MKEPVQIRDLDKLNGVVKVLLEMALERIKACNITPLVVETYRTQERQYWLYGQGRNALQLMKKKVPIKYAHKGKIVTQTINSIHTSGCAVDLIPVRNGFAIWDSNDVQTKKIIEIMEYFGFEAGANWKSFPDSPHFQIKLPSPEYISISQYNTTPYLTRVIQRKLGIKSDGIWGKQTNEAVSLFRQKHHLNPAPILYAENLKRLF